MKNLLLFGDGVLFGPDGFGDYLIAQFFLAQPAAVYTFNCHGRDELCWDEALEMAPFHILGRAPQGIVLGLGHSDIHLLRPMDQVFCDLSALLDLIVGKSQATIYLCQVCPSLFAGDEEKLERVSAYNSRLVEKQNSRIKLMRFSDAVEDFLSQHRKGRGEKHSIHSQWNRLTILGRILFANILLSQIRQSLDK